MNGKNMYRDSVLALAVVCMLQGSPTLAEDVPSLESLLEMSVEDLVNIEVTSGTRVKVSVRKSPTISTVVTREEIRAMGARTLEDILNLVPGVTVGRGQQINASESDLSIRGSKSFFGEDVLILWNGVRLNDPLSGGALAFSPDFPVATTGFWSSGGSRYARTPNSRTEVYPERPVTGYSIVNAVMRFDTSLCEVPVTLTAQVNNILDEQQIGSDARGFYPVGLYFSERQWLLGMEFSL